MGATIFLILIFNLFLNSAFAAEKLLEINIQSESSQYQNQRAKSWVLKTTKTSAILNSSQTEDSLNSLSGLQTRTQGSPTFSIRGSAQSGRSLILFNDTPLNFASSFGAPSIFLPKEMVGSVSILKGPASLFYGSQALSGSINFMSKKYLSPSMTLTLSDTNESFLPWREQSLSHNSIQVATPLYQNKNNHLQISYFNEKDDGQFPYQNKNSSGVRSFNSQNLNRFVLNGSSYHRKFKIDYDSILGQQVIQSPGSTVFPQNTRQESRGVLASVTPHYFFTDNQSLKNKISYLASNSDFLENLNSTYTNQKTWIFQNEYVLDIGQRTTFHMYFDYYSHSIDSSFSGDNLKQNQFEWGPLLEFYLLKNLKHQLGGRHITQQNEWVPSLINQYQFDNSEAWLSYSQGFKNPTLTDLYSQSPSFKGNPDLKPEKSKQIEIGYRTLPNNYEFLPTYEVRVFQINYDNFIESRESTPSVFTRINRGEGYSRGLDFDISQTWARFNGMISYNYLDTKNKTDGGVFRLSPRHQFSLNGKYDFKSIQLEVQNTLWSRYYDISNNQNVRLEDWQQWNFLLHVNLIKNMSMSLGLINAFNQGKELTLNYPEPQRKYWLQIHYSL
jgi:outer membrane receptor protein involved in Fe transport